MRADCLKMNVLQLNKFMVGKQEIGFEIPALAIAMAVERNNRRTKKKRRNR